MAAAVALIGVASVAVGGDSANVPAPSAAVGSAEEWQGFIDGNCVACHSERLKSGGLVLEKAALSPIGPRADVWEKVIHKVEAGEMPPPSVRRRPDAHQSAGFTAWLTRSLDEYAAKNPDAGRPTMRRLTRVEYSNAVRDLFAVDVNPGAQLPPDAVTAGFNNIGETLSLSPLLLEKYMAAGRQVTRLAIGDKTLPRTVYTFNPPERQDYWRTGLPFGARGMPATEHYFSADGEYVIRVFTDLYSGLRLAGGRLPETEGVRFFQQRVKVTAGPHRISVVVPEEGAAPQGPIPDIPGWAGGLGGPLDPLRLATRKPILDIRLDGKRVGRFEVNPPSAIELGTPTTVTPGAPWLRRVEVDGPYNASGPGQTESRARIFTCTPTAPRQEAACAQRILAATVRRAFRRDVAARDVQPFMAIYTKARAKSDFEGSVQQALQAVLVSPAFLFRIERDPDRVKAGQNYAVDNYELATRLSFFLWSSIPDDKLLDVAKSGRLTNPATLESETRRMLADPKAKALVDNFGFQLLGLQDLEAFEPDKRVYPTFSATLKEDMAEEAKLLLRSVLFEKRSVVDLIGANHTFLNERLAKHYGIPGVIGPEFRRVTFGANDPRGGVLGLGAVLLVTSHQNITSPVLRGKWVLANLLNQPPSPPPPGIPALVAASPTGGKLTGRQQMEQHRTSPVCSSCHARMDPFGFALENYDVVGVWRAKDEGGDVNPAVTMPDGTGFSGPTGLKQRLLSRQDDFVRAFTERLMTYSLGRRLTGADAPTVRGIVAEAKPGGYNFEDLVVELVKSTPFRMRRKASANVL
jgi:hypothetical protein